jgi:hypothetical protein
MIAFPWKWVQKHSPLADTFVIGRRTGSIAYPEDIDLSTIHHKWHNENPNYLEGIRKTVETILNERLAHTDELYACIFWLS